MPVLFVAIVLVLAAGIGATSFVRDNNSIGGQSSTGPSALSAGPSPLRSFQSVAQLQDFMAANAQSAQAYDSYGGAGLIGGPGLFPGGSLTVSTTSAVTMTETSAAGLSAQSAAPSDSSTPSFTGTNVQVQGVDEPDIVKTDGTHLFVASTGSSNNSTVDILQAYPPTSQAVLSKLSLSGQVVGIEIAQDRLMVIDQGYSNGTANIGLFLYNTADLSPPG